MVCKCPAGLCHGQNPKSVADGVTTQTGASGVFIPETLSSSFHFPISGSQQPLATFTEPFVAYACNDDDAFNMSFRKSHTPAGTEDYAIHYSILSAFPNNVTGACCSLMILLLLQGLHLHMP